MNTQLTPDEARELERLVDAAITAVFHQGLHSTEREGRDQRNTDADAAAMALHRWQLDHGLMAVRMAELSDPTRRADPGSPDQ